MDNQQDVSLGTASALSVDFYDLCVLRRNSSESMHTSQPLQQTGFSSAFRKLIPLAVDIAYGCDRWGRHGDVAGLSSFQASAAANDRVVG